MYLKKINLFDFYPDLDVDGSDLAIFAADYGRENCPCLRFCYNDGQ